ncbi:hypothetical protein [Neorhizobium petrolearium]|uniref:hypothetical protein n=1 Tax=Neorhizobium petrolearium TaxID=515361 RepID=UPI003F7D8064
MKATIENLERLIGVVDAVMAALPEYDYRDYETSRAYHRAAEAAIAKLAEKESGRVKLQGDAASLRLGGLRSTATGGAVGLMRNWQNAARTRIEQIKAGAA